LLQEEPALMSVTIAEVRQTVGAGLANSLPHSVKVAITLPDTRNIIKPAKSFSMLQPDPAPV
jgi:hypothetical protein